MTAVRCAGIVAMAATIAAFAFPARAWAASASGVPAASNGIFDVATNPFGARGNGRSDDAGAIQGALNAACERSEGDAAGAQVRLPPGEYRISRPLLLECSGLEIAGFGKRNTGLRAGFAGGPMLVAIPKGSPGVPLAPGLFGSGHAISFPRPSSEGYVLDLRSAPTMDLDGLRALTVEFTIRFSSLGYDTIIGSGDVSGRNRALEIIIDGKSTVAAYLNIGGKEHYLYASGLRLRTGANYHVALDYDGSSIRLFWNGHEVASQQATGTIRQAADEGTTLGGTPRGPMGMGMLRGIAGGFALDSIRISDIARYRRDFRPPSAKFRVDSAAMLLLNAQENPSIFTVAESRQGKVWLPRMDMTYKHAMSFVRVHDLELNGSGPNGSSASGILAIECNQCSYDRVFVEYARIGVQFFNNSYRSAMSRPKVTAGGQSWIDFLEDSSSGPVDLTDAHFDGGAIGIYSAGGGIYSRVYMSVSTATVYPLYLAHGSSETDFTLLQPSVDFEPAGPSRLLTALFLDGPSKVAVMGGVLEAYNGRPIVKINGGDNLTFIGTEFNSGGRTVPRPAEIVRFEKAPTSPVVLVNPQIRGPGGVPLTRTPAAVTVVGGAGGPMKITGGGVQVNPIARPAAPTVEAKEGGTRYTYYLVAHDLAGNPTLPSGGTTASGAAKPDNKVCARPQPGAYYFDVLRGDVGHKVGTISPYQYTDALPSYCFVDTVVSPSPYATPRRNATGDLSAPVIFNGCAGRARLSRGTTLVKNECITGGRPIGCTDNSAGQPTACSAVPSPGALRLHGSGSDEVSWFQM
jgi:Concanavalin A-like lectin/glucanases superfamily